MLDIPDRIAPLSLTASAADPDGFAREFGVSFARYGFAVVTDHGLDPALVARGWAMTRD